MVSLRDYERFKTPLGRLIYEDWRDEASVHAPLLYAEVENKIQERQPIEMDFWYTSDGGEVVCRRYSFDDYDVIEKIWLHWGVGVGRRLEIIWK